MHKRRFIAITALGLALFGLGGCGKKTPPEPGPGLSAQGDVVSLTLGENHMTRYDFYSYHLREKDGQILFDAHYWAEEDEEYREITLENAAAAREDMEALRALCGEYHFAERQRDYRKPKPGSGPFVADAPTLGLDVIWENGARLDADTDFGSEQALRAFFETLATRLE